MKRERQILTGWTLLFARFACSLFLCAALIGCGGDDAEKKVADGTGGGTADGTGGAAGSEAGAGGDTEDSITAEQKQAVCQCWFDLVDIHVPRLQSQCEDMVSDSCVKCTERVTNGASCAGMDEADFTTCLDNCLNLVSEPETVEECKEMVEAGTDDPEAVSAGTCMCENCFEDYAPCMANSACLRVMLCVAERGCNGIDCMQDPVCSSVIGDSLGADPSLVEPLTVNIANCSTQFSCQGLSADTDGGTEAGDENGE